MNRLEKGKSLPQLVPLRLGPYDRISAQDRMTLRPKIEEIASSSLAKISQGRSRAMFYDAVSGTSVVVSRPEDDHLGPFYKAGSGAHKDIPAASVVIEEYAASEKNGFVELLAFRKAL